MGWLVDNTHFINTLLPLVIPGLEKTDLALTSVLTLKRIKRECRFNLNQSLAIELVEVMRRSLHQGKLQPQEQLWVIQSCGHVLSAVNEEICLSELEKTVQPYVIRLDEATNG